MTFDRFAQDPAECRGHYWQWDPVVITTHPPLYTQYCSRCPAYRERYHEEGAQWSEPTAHERFRRSDPCAG